MMSPGKRQRRGGECTWNARQERKVEFEREKRPRLGLSAQKVGLESRLYWFFWLFLSPSQRTPFAYDVWLLHSRLLQRGTQVGESGTSGTLCYTAAARTAWAGRTFPLLTSQLRWELVYAKESKRDIHLLVDPHERDSVLNLIRQQAM